MNQEEIEILDIDNKKNQKNNKKFIPIILSFLLISLLIIGLINYNNFKFEKEQEIMDKRNYQEALKYYKGMFIKNSQEIKNDLTLDYVEKCKSRICKINHKYKKKEMLTNLTKIKKYIELKNEIDLLFDNDIMKSTLTNDDLNNFKKRFNILDIKYQPLLKSKIENMEIQYNNITNLINSVKDLFVNEQYQDVKLDINRDNYNSVLNMLNQLKQEDIKNQQLTYLQKVEQVITQREIEYQRKLAEEKRQREIAIANAWVKLNVP